MVPRFLAGHCRISAQPIHSIHPRTCGMRIAQRFACAIVERFTESSGRFRQAMSQSAKRTGTRAYLQFKLPGGKKAGTNSGFGHADTVGRWARCGPCRSGGRKGRLWGPGVLDMKAGLAFFIFAMRALRELEIPVAHEVVLLVNPDEETGSQSSRGDTEALAKESRAVLVLEPGTGLDRQTQNRAQGHRRLTR